MYHVVSDRMSVWRRSDEELLRERGEYWLIVYNVDDGSSNDTLACDLVLYNDPPNIYMRKWIG